MSLTLPDGTKRVGQVLEVAGNKAVVQVRPLFSRAHSDVVAERCLKERLESMPVQRM